MSQAHTLKLESRERSGSKAVAVILTPLKLLVTVLSEQRPQSRCAQTEIKFHPHFYLVTDVPDLFFFLQTGRLWLIPGIFWPIWNGCAACESSYLFVFPSLRHCQMSEMVKSFFVIPPEPAELFQRNLMSSETVKLHKE